MSQSQTSLLGTPVGDITLIGYILPPETRAAVRGDGGGDEEEEEDSGSDQEPEQEEEPEFLDMSEMQGGGGHRLRSSVPSRDEVRFQDLVSGNRYQVEGRFALRGPWWEVTCAARSRGKGKLVVQGYPRYKLRLDLDREGWLPLVSLFLTACVVEPPELVAQFFEWLPPHRDLTLFNLMEVLEEFERGGNVGAAQCLRARFTKSDAGMQVYAASLYPLVMMYLPTLLPGHFLELLKKGKARVTPCHPQQPATASTQAPPAVPGPPDEQSGTEQEMEEQEMEADDLQLEDLSLLNQLEQMLTTDVWKLGFNYVMYKELRLTRCEAQLQAFIDCDLLEEIPPLQCTALRAYDRLKRHCYRTGSTYMDQQRLCDDLRADAGTADWDTWESLQFLRGLGVVAFDRQKKVGLHNFYSYETGITGCLRHLLEGEQWTIPLDAREVLRAAAVERRRARMMQAGDANAEQHGANVKKDLHNANGRSDGGDAASMPLPHDEKTPSVKSEPGGGDGEEEEEEEDPESLLPPIELDEDQVRAAEMICANPVTVISGKGGCGKTTVVSLLFKAAIAQRRASDADEVRNACADFENDINTGSLGWDDQEAPPPPPPPLSPPGFLSRSAGAEEKEEKEEEGKGTVHGADEVLLTAPTGRAASLLTKKTCFTAYTLHQVLWSFMKSEKDESGCPTQWKFACVRVLVVDEGSLVCVQLLHNVLSMLTKHAKLRKFIILGDVRQLPSIQPGNTLCDLFDSLKLRSWAIEMKTNHRAESELIVRNAGLIADMGMKKCSYRNLEFDAVVDLNGPRTMASADKKFIHIRLPRDESDDDLYNAIKLLIDSAPGLKDDNTSQFIAFRRVDVALINELCCTRYNDHTTIDHRKRLLFQPGDKVCCTKNGYINNSEDAEAGLPSSDGGETGDPENKDKLRLCNGEIFFIREDKQVEEAGSSRRKRRCRYLTLDDCDGRMVKVDFKELQRECRLQHAWARTIHTFQGSENETIVYVLGNSQAQTWKHVYTAVTRGQKRVYVVARQEAIAAAITKRETPRTTRLSGLLKKVLDESRTVGAGVGVNNAVPSPPGTPGTPHGTPARPLGLLQSPSTQPLASPRTSRDPCLHPSSTLSVRKSLWKPAVRVKAEVPDDDQSVMDDMVFSQAYSWSPMNSEEERFGLPKEQPPSPRVASGGAVVEDGCQVRPAVSQETPSKRLHPDMMMGTPPKQIKTEPEPEKPSPLGCSTLQKLSLHTPKSSRQPPSE